MPYRQGGKAFSLDEEHGASQHSEGTRTRPRHIREGPVEVLRTSRLNDLKPHSQRPCCDFCFLQHVLIRVSAEEKTRLPENSDSIDPRNGLLELLQTLADKRRGEEGQSRDIAARPRKTGDEAARYRIGRIS